MIIWNGLGFLVFVFVFGCSFVGNLITNATIGEPYYDEHKWPFGVSLIVAALLSWSIGMLLAKRKTKTLVDTKTGEKTVITPKHTLFFIKMHWWGPILAITGAVFIVLDVMN